MRMSIICERGDEPTDSGMLWFPGCDAVTLISHLHGVTTMFLLILSVLLAQQGTAQQTQHTVTMHNLHVHR